MSTLTYYVVNYVFVYNFELFNMAILCHDMSSWSCDKMVVSTIVMLITYLFLVLTMIMVDSTEKCTQWVF